MTHSTGAAYALDRLKPSTFGSAEYAKEELVAELTAALTASKYGMEKGKNGNGDIDLTEVPSNAIDYADRVFRTAGTP